MNQLLKDLLIVIGTGHVASKKKDITNYTGDKNTLEMN